MTITIDYIFTSYYSLFLSQAKNIVGRHDVAEDIIQNAIINFLETKPEKVNEIQEVRGYLLRSIRNECLNYRKHEKITRIAHNKIYTLSKSSEEPEYINKITRKVIMSRVRDLTPQLSKQQQQIFVMVHSRQMQLKDIAKELGIKASTARAQYKRCVDFMVKHIRDKE